MSRIPLPYNPKVMDCSVTQKPWKKGRPTVVAVAGNPARGRLKPSTLKIENNTITKPL